MIASLFDTKKTNEFADWIVAEVKRVIPTDLSSRKTKKKHVSRARAMDDNIARQVVEFTRTTPLNIYKKARFAARVREGLTEHGYPKEFVESFSLELIERIQTAKKA
jgi:isocitrate dehydrogenase kinase/phosphatase